MCAVAPIIAAVVTAGATMYAANEQKKAQNESNKAMMEAQQQAQKEAQMQAGSPQATAQDVTATMQENRRRVAGAQGGASTVTGAGNLYGAMSGGSGLLGG